MLHGYLCCQGYNGGYQYPATGYGELTTHRLPHPPFNYHPHRYEPMIETTTESTTTTTTEATTPKKKLNRIVIYPINLTDMGIMDLNMIPQRNQQPQQLKRPQQKQQLSNHTRYIQLQAATQDQSQSYYQNHMPSQSTIPICCHGELVTKGSLLSNRNAF